jgi:Cu(I)/Ag(I) efflux system membrane fusion protein
MHPEIIKDKPGNCDICGMELVKTEAFGYGRTQTSKEKPLVIPASAPLITGRRSVVYVEIKDKDRPTYEGREVVLGPRAGDYYVVKSGINEGETVVSNGAFRIDSELQIHAKPSLMNPEGSGPVAGHQHGGPLPSVPQSAAPDKKEGRQKHANGISQEFLKSIEPVYAAYFNAQDALAKDDMKSAKENLKKLSDNLNKVKMQELDGNAHKSWMSISDGIRRNLEHVLHYSDISQIREAFRLVSSGIIELEKNFGHSDKKEHVVVFCPMAFGNKGGSWMQSHTAVMNPFFGTSMQKCGDIKERYKHVP